MSTADRVRGRRVRLSRRARPTGRYFTMSFLLHVALIAAAVLFFGKPPDEPVPIEVTVILETGEEVAGQVDAPTPQQTEIAPRPNPKPVAPLRKAAPPKAAPVVRQTSVVPTESLPVVEQAPAQATSPTASTNANDGQSEKPAESGSAFGQPAASASGAGAGKAASGGGTKGRGADDYLERVRAALAKHKRYPDQAKKLKQEGTVSISLHLARDGTVLGAQIARGSGFALLDEAALQMARDASPVPRVPDDIDGDSVKIALPVTFSIGFFGRF